MREGRSREKEKEPQAQIPRMCQPLRLSSVAVQSLQRDPNNSYEAEEQATREGLAKFIIVSELFVARQGSYFGLGGEVYAVVPSHFHPLRFYFHSRGAKLSSPSIFDACVNTQGARNHMNEYEHYIRATYQASVSCASEQG